MFNIFFARDNIKITRFPGRDLTLLDGPGAVAEFGGLGAPPPPRGNDGQGIQFQQRPCASTTNFEEKKNIFLLLCSTILCWQEWQKVNSKKKGRTLHIVLRKP